MNSETMQIISLIGFGLAGIFLIISVVVFFRQHIFDVISVLRGKRASKNIQKIWDDKQNARDTTSGKLTYFENRANQTGPNTTGKMGSSTDPLQAESFGNQDNDETELLDDDATEFLDNDETVLLDNDETDLLDVDETELLDDEKTEVLGEQAGFRIIKREMGVNREFIT